MQGASSLGSKNCCFAHILNHSHRNQHHHPKFSSTPVCIKLFVPPLMCNEYLSKLFIQSLSHICVTAIGFMSSSNGFIVSLLICRQCFITRENKSFITFIKRHFKGYWHLNKIKFLHNLPKYWCKDLKIQHFLTWLMKPTT